MKRYLLTVFIVLLTFCAIAQTAKPTRYRLLMDPNWKFKLGEQPLAETLDYVDDNWQTLDLPHDWSIQNGYGQDATTGGGGGYVLTGIGWYRKHFVLPATAKGKQVSIEFDGVYRNSEVWINGHLLGKRPNGYISFAYDVTPYLVKGGNVIAVKVDNSEQPNSRWYSGSGIYRHVWLNLTNPAHIAQWGVQINTPVAEKDSAVINVKTTLANWENSHVVSVLAVVMNAQNHETARNEMVITGDQVKSGIVNQTIHLSRPSLWTLNNPYLYHVVSYLKVNGQITDTYTISFGIRKIEYSATNGFLLNGQPVKMNGVCLHHDGGSVGAAVPIKIWRLRLANLKAMGCNAIRTSHNTVAPEFLDLCDEMGMLVMDETFDVWEGSKEKYDYHMFFSQWSKIDLANQIHRDYNHPSVVLWSAGNEIHDQSSARGTAVLKELLAVFHKEDPTRPVTTASDEIAADGKSTRLDFLEAEDIVGYNYVDRWHERRELYYSIDKQAHPDWKMIGTESTPIRSASEYSLGNDPSIAKPNYNTGFITAEQLWKFVKVHNYVIGDFMWTGIDYLGEARWPAKGSSSGVIDMINQPKDGYYFYQSQWVSQPVLHLFPHWNWAGREGQIIPVVAFTNCDTVELFVNGKSWGMKMQEFPRPGTSGGWNKYDKPEVRSTSADLHLSWDVPYQPGVLKAVGRKNGKQIIQEIQTTGAPAEIRLSTDTMKVLANGSDVSVINVTVTDSQGNIVPTATNSIKYTITGSGKLLGLDNGDLRDLTLFQSNERKAYKGKAQLIVQAGRQVGTITVTAHADGIKDASITVSTIATTDKDIL